MNATGGSGGAGLGTGRRSYCAGISITGGTVGSTSGGSSPGLGTGAAGRCGEITIANTVTRVTATAGTEGSYHAIGTTQDGTCGKITVGGTVYWDGTGYTNNGSSTIGQSTYTYPPQP